MADYTQIQALVQEAGENFPVASWLLPKHARRGILHFYAVARHADDIADSPTLSAEEKIRSLAALQNAIRHARPENAPDWALAYIRDTAQGMSDPQHGVDLLHAFLQDAHKNRYVDFAELLDYCRYSAAPVGRVVLECCGEDCADLQAADALCMLLQLINHLQDCQKDYHALNRIYLPQDWMRQQGISEAALNADATSPALHKVFTLYLEECRQLFAIARALPATVRHRRLRLELGFILVMAEKLVEKLAREDVLRHSVTIPKWQWPFYFLRSLRYL